MSAPTKGCCHELEDRFALVHIARRVAEPFLNADMKEHTYYPTIYLSGVHELIGVLLILIRCLHFLFLGNQPSEFDYTAEVGIGSTAMAISSLNVGFAYRYWWLRMTSLTLMAPVEPATWASRFNSFAMIALAISTQISLCLWLIPNKRNPMDQPVDEVLPLGAVGRGIISCYAVVLYGAYLGNMLNIVKSPREDAVKQTHKVFAIIYGLCVIYLLIAWGSLLREFLVQGKHYQDLPWHPNAASWPTQVVLVVCTACLLFVNSFMPRGPAVVIRSQVGDMEDEGDSSDNGSSSGVGSSVGGTEVDEPRVSHCPCPGWLARNCVIRLILRNIAIINLLNQPLASRVFYPKNYLGATHEVFAISLYTTWGVTLIIPAFRPQIYTHPAKVIIGSWNPCFGWDYAPASWIAVCLCSFNVYFSYRYAWFKLMRKQLLREPNTLASRFNQFATYTLGVSSNLWLCLWIIGPNPKDPVGDADGPEIFWWSLHTGIFVFYAASAYGAFLGNLLDIFYGPRYEVIDWTHKAFAIVYGLSVAYLLFVYAYSLANFEEGKGVPALGSGIFTQVADFVWMACVLLAYPAMPREPPLKQETLVVQTLPQAGEEVA